MPGQELVPLEVFDIRSDGRFSTLLLLRNEERVLPIKVGIMEADAIVAALTKRDLGRPMTHDLICNLLAGLRGDLKSIVIYKIDDGTFYAHLNIEQTNADGQIDQVLRIDARPSDSIAVACRVQCPILAAEEVMEAEAVDISRLIEEEEDDEDLGEGGSGEEPEFGA